jgi:hypothetical protein
MQVDGDRVPLSNYNTANPLFIAPIVPYPTALTFQLIVNNGQEGSLDYDKKYIESFSLRIYSLTYSLFTSI